MKAILLGGIDFDCIDPTFNYYHKVKVHLQLARVTNGPEVWEGTFFKTKRGYYIRFEFDKEMMTVFLGFHLSVWMYNDKSDKIIFMIDLDKGRKNNKYTPDFNGDSFYYENKIRKLVLGESSWQAIGFAVDSLLDDMEYFGFDLLTPEDVKANWETLTSS